MKEKIQKEKKKKIKEKEYSYLETIGRRKTSVARVRIYKDHPKKTEFIINEKPLKEYFPLERYQKKVLAPFEAVGQSYRTTVKIKGSGLNAQSEAIRHGLARALVALEPSYRGILKQLGYLTRDPRMVERKHPGLRKARRAQQWRKR